MTDPPSGVARPVALVTGVDRMAGIGAGIACRLAASGWDIAFTFQGRTFSGAADPAPDALEGVLAAHVRRPRQSRSTSPIRPRRPGSSTRLNAGWAPSPPS